MKTNRLPNRRTLAIAFAAVLVLAAARFLLPSDPVSGREIPPVTPPVAARTVEEQTPDINMEPKEPGGEAPVTAIPASVTGLLAAFAAELHALAAENGLTKEERAAKARSLLARFRERLRGLPADQAAAAIVAFLNTGRDAATGLGFTLMAGGGLDDAPTLRTTLLDLLGQLDPTLAVSYARTIFHESQNTDEWALALRSLGWQNQDGAHTAELRTRLAQMLENDAWLARPSEGFLEAFDLAVHLGGTAEFAAMASVMNLQDTAGNPVNNGATHAAYLALDRITVQNPGQALAQFGADPSFLSWAPEQRGSLIARADVTVPGQLAALETCLATMANRPQELETFTAMFPNRNGLLGNALVSTPRPEIPNSILLAGDRAALAAVNGWLQRGAFPGIEENLRTISARLQGFLADASAAAR